MMQLPEPPSSDQKIEETYQIAGVCHDLGTCAFWIQGYLELILQSLNLLVVENSELIEAQIRLQNFQKEVAKPLFKTFKTWLNLYRELHSIPSPTSSPKSVSVPPTKNSTFALVSQLAKEEPMAHAVSDLSLEEKTSDTSLVKPPQTLSEFKQQAQMLLIGAPLTLTTLRKHIEDIITSTKEQAPNYIEGLNEVKNN